MFRQMAYVSAALFSLVGAEVARASQVEVSLHGQVLPGVHGHVRLVDPYPRYDRVIVIEAPHHHRRDWGRYCHHYGACDRQVRFVEVREYEEHRHWHKPKKHRHKHHHHCHH